MKYRKKPVVIEAMEWTGHNRLQILDFCGFPPGDAHVKIETLEGVMSANVGDFIIKGVQGEFYPCKPDIFWQTYEPVGEETE